jgi:hypothetical protein
MTLSEWWADALQRRVVDVVGWAINWIVHAPEPHLTSAWFRGEYGIALHLAMWMLLPIIFAATISALLRGGLQEVLRTYLWGLPIGVFGGVVTVALIEICIDIDGELTRAVLSRSQDTIQSFYDALNRSTVSPAANSFQGDWAFVQLVVMALFLALVVMLVVEMIFREVMIYMGAMFIPFSLAAFIWGPVRVWFYTLAELVTTMIFAKFVIASVMSFGFTALAYAVTGQGHFSDAQFGVMLGGVAVFVIACLTGPALVAFVMNPGHAILSFKAAKQVTPWNHDRKYAGQLFAKNYKAIKSKISSAGSSVAT